MRNVLMSSAGALCLTFLCGGYAALAENSAPRPRFALLIGNSEYSKQPPPEPESGRLSWLKNPCNDVREVGAKLVQVAHWSDDDVVIKCDASKKEMEDAIREFVLASVNPTIRLHCSTSPGMLYRLTRQATYLHGMRRLTRLRKLSFI